jgi:hypothetical protein
MGKSQDRPSQLRPSDRGHLVRWVDICRTLRMFGHMHDYSKSECFRVNAELKKLIKKGQVEQVGRRRYRRIIKKGEDAPSRTGII